MRYSTCFLTACEPDAAIHPLALTSGEMTESAYTTWLEQHSIQVP